MGAYHGEPIMFSQVTDAMSQALDDLRNRKRFASSEAEDSYLIACHINHLRAPRSAYRAAPKPSTLAQLGGIVLQQRKELEAVGDYSHLHNERC